MTSFTSATLSSAAALLSLFISLSPVSAGAFSCSLSPSSTLLSSLAISNKNNCPSTSLWFTKSSAAAAASATTRIMRVADSPQSVVLSLSELALLRGGEQADKVEILHDDTRSLDADINMQQVYGTNDAIIDEELDPSFNSASVEMITKASTSLKSKKSDLSSDYHHESPTTFLPSSRLMTLSSAILSPISSTLATFASIYSHQLSARPLLTKSLTAGIIFMASDYCAQLIERSSEKVVEEDKIMTPLVWSRIFTNFLVGLLVFGPAANLWYSMVFKMFPSTSLFSTFQKAVLGQLIFGPAFTSVFFGAGMIQGGSFSFSGWLQKVHQDLPAVWATGLSFWPFVDFISYKVIPVQWIPLFVNFCSFAWTIYLSIMSNRGRGEEDEEELHVLRL